MRKQLQFILLICLLGNTFSTSAQNGVKQIFYIVRHAEKDTGNNPVLSNLGMHRSGNLYRYLKTKKITAIYVTKYRRTKMTADSLSIYENVPIIEYKTDTTGNGLSEKMDMNKNYSINVLIVGHSNTILPIIQKLGVNKMTLNEIPDDEYDNIFIVTRQHGKVTLKIVKYGTLSHKNLKQSTMAPLQ
jgi:broad specificity phosphatase PhoE